MDIKISQSLMKDLQSYYMGQECGNLIKARYIDNLDIEGSEAMLLGQYFEYMATGQLPKNKQVPEPKTLKNGNLAVGYERAYASAMYCKTMFETMNIEILEKGLTLSHGDLIGTFDLLARWDGKLCVIDLKYSGLLDNKWDERGWDFDMLSQKDKLMIQSVHYKIIAENHYNEEVDFYFFLFSSTNPNDVRIAKIVIDPMREMKHIEDVKRAKTLWERFLGTQNLKNYPTLAKCSDCPLKDECKDRTLLPIITNIYY